MIRASGTVAWSDTDASGRIHFTAPFKWVENAEHDFYRGAGAEPGTFPRRVVGAEYHRPLAAGDHFTVELIPERTGGTSIAWTWTISTDNGVAVSGSFVVVHVDDDGRPAPLPERLRGRLSRAVVNTI